MGVSQNNNRLFLAIVLGMLMASGCSGHSVKYGANSEGEETAQNNEEMNESGERTPHGTVRNTTGTTVDGGTVDGNSPYMKGREGSQDSVNSGDMTSQAMVNGTSGGPESGVDYGRQYGGVDGSGPNHGPVTGFGSGAADPNNPDPEAWANAYLQEGKSSQEFYGDPTTSGSKSNSGNGEKASYGHDYDGVPGSGPNYGAVDGFSQGSASSMEVDPEAWARAYVQENGGPSPEHVSPDMNIVQANGHKGSGSLGMQDPNGDPMAKANTKSSVSEGRVEDIYFAFDSWSISTDAAGYLEESAQWFHANPEKALTIEGHCDQRGTQDYNLVLGKKRAEAAREYLVNLGVQHNRIKIVSYGKERPFCQNSNEGCFQENRRNHMVVRINQS